DFRRIMNKVGFVDFRITKESPITIDNAKIEEQCGPIKFVSRTIRAFKLEELEDRCEDYGQVAVYHGTTEEDPKEFELDSCHVFPKDVEVKVCSNTALMLSET